MDSTNVGRNAGIGLLHADRTLSGWKAASVEMKGFGSPGVGTPAR